jgi:hypothetical protein
MKNEGLIWLKRRRRVDEDSSVLKYDVKEGSEDSRPLPPPLLRKTCRTSSRDERGKPVMHIVALNPD